MVRVLVLRSLLAAALIGAPALARAQVAVDRTLNAASAASPCPTDACLEVPGVANGVAVQITDSASGTWTAQFEGSISGVSWVALSLTPPGTTTAVTSATAAGVWRGAAGVRFRVRISAYTSGQPRVAIVPLTAPPVAGGGPGGSSFDGVLLDAAGGDAITDTVNNALRVNIIAGAGSGGTALADRSGTFTPNVTSFTPIGGFMDETTPDACTEGAPCAFRMTAARQLRVDGTGGSFPVTDSGGSLTVDNGGTFAVQAAQSGTWNITNVSGTVSLPTGAATATNQTTEITALQIIDNLPNTLGSTTAGQSGALALGAVTTAAPSYTTAQTNALSLTVAGVLRTGLFTGAGVELTPAQDSIFGTATYTEATTTGPAAGAVRNDTLDALVNTTNEIGPLATTSTGALWVAQPDPCSFTAKTFLPFNITSATTTEITPALAGASTNYYVCSLVMVTGVANNVALVDDDTDNCASVTSGMAGGTAAANGFNFAANGGIVAIGGNATVAKTNGANRVVCLVTSSAGPLAGTMGVVAAP